MLNNDRLNSMIKFSAYSNNSKSINSQIVYVAIFLCFVIFLIIPIS